MSTTTTFRNADEFYTDSLRLLKDSQVPFLLGGTFAVNTYTGLNRPTKDMDIFCRASDFPKILRLFSHHEHYRATVEDERWIAKVTHNGYFFDVIFNSANSMTPVRDEWFTESLVTHVFGLEVSVLPPTELIWAKVFVQDRYKYDGSDIAHLIQKQHARVNWERLLSYADQFWEVLLVHVLNFRFIYPSERELIPRWLFDELIERLQSQANLPTSQMKVCRGRLFSRSDYAIDVTDWGFADVVGRAGEYKR